MPALNSGESGQWAWKESVGHGAVTIALNGHFKERIFRKDFLFCLKCPVTWYWPSSDTCLVMEKGSGGKVRSFSPKGDTCLAATEEEQQGSY